MPDENKEKTNSENVNTEEALETLQVESDLAALQTIEEYEAELQKLSDTNKKLFARAKKAEAKAKETKPPVEAPKEKEETKINTPTEDTAMQQRLDRLELKADGYSPKEIDFIMKQGGLAAKDDEFVQEAIAALREKQKSQDAAPEGSPKSPVYKKYTQAELQDMSVEQLKKILPHAD